MILDFGCGIGNWLRTRAGTPAIGVDIDARVIRKAKDLYGDSETEFLVCDCHYLPFREGVFNYVHDGYVLHHMEDWRRGLSEICRVLAGKMEIKEAVNDNPLFAFGRKILKKWGKQDIKSQFTSSELKKEIHRNGFTIISEKYEDDFFNYVPLLNLWIFSYLSKPRLDLPCWYVVTNSAYNWFLRRVGLSRVLASSVSIIATNERES